MTDRDEVRVWTLMRCLDLNWRCSHSKTLDSETVIGEIVETVEKRHLDEALAEVRKLKKTLAMKQSFLNLNRDKVVDQFSKIERYENALRRIAYEQLNGAANMRGLARQTLGESDEQEVEG